jgi:hypothetical protein
MFHHTAYALVKAEHAVLTNALFDLHPALAQLDSQGIGISKAQIMVLPARVALHPPRALSKPGLHIWRDLARIEPTCLYCGKHGKRCLALSVTSVMSVW